MIADLKERYIRARLLWGRIANSQFFKGASKHNYPARFAHPHELKRILGRHGETLTDTAQARAWDPQQLRRQHDVPVLAAFTLLDADQHPAAINGSCRQANNLADPQALPPI
jgi:hypothetical protein